MWLLTSILFPLFWYRNLLGYLLLFSEELNNCHVATRCCKLDHLYHSEQEGLKSAYDIHGAGAVACYDTGKSNQKFTFPTCTNQCSSHPGAIKYLQKYYFTSLYACDCPRNLIPYCYCLSLFPARLCICTARSNCFLLNRETNFFSIKFEYICTVFYS